MNYMVQRVILLLDILSDLVGELLIPILDILFDLVKCKVIFILNLEVLRELRTHCNVSLEMTLLYLLVWM